MSIRAVFFDAGETLVHPHPSFPELVGEILRMEGHDISPEAVRGKVHLLSEQFARASRSGELWTTSPERSKGFWLGVYETFLADLGVDAGGGTADLLYEEFTKLSNYRAFDDVPRALVRLAAAGLLLGVISNFEEWLEQLLEHLDLARYFTVRIISGIEGI